MTKYYIISYHKEEEKEKFLRGLSTIEGLQIVHGKEHLNLINRNTPSVFDFTTDFKTIAYLSERMEYCILLRKGSSFQRIVKFFHDNKLPYQIIKLPNRRSLINFKDKTGREVDYYEYKSTNILTEETEKLWIK